MFRYLSSITFIGLSIAVFFIFTSPMYHDIQDLKSKQGTYAEASSNSKALENERDKLTAKYSNISVENLERIRKFLPDSVDNIRLILEIEKIAQPYGMALKDVQYSVVDTKKDAPDSAPITSGLAPADASANKNYGSWDLGFSTTGTYADFLSFLHDLESNLRIVDISSIQFSSGAGPIGGSSTSEVYRYTFNIRTYWLKN